MTRHLLTMAMILAIAGLLTGCARQTTSDTGTGGTQVAGTQESAGSATISVMGDRLSMSPSNVSLNDGTITVTNADNTAKIFTIMGSGQGGRSQQVTLRPGDQYSLRIRKTSQNHYEISAPKPAAGKTGGR
ncbi:MAG: hypothetical protein ACYDBB_05560 [Armatimonadota bacterium]